MFQVIKILLGLFIGFLVTILIVNKIDANPNKTLKTYQKLQENHKLTNKKISLTRLMRRVADDTKMKSLRLDLQFSPYACFSKSTCSDRDYNLAAAEAPRLLKKHSGVLLKLQTELKNNLAVTISPKAKLAGKLFFSLNSLIKLQIIEINYLYSQANSDQTQTDRATKTASMLDNFILKSLYLPNYSVTSVILSARLNWLRSSLQKYAPSRINLPEVDSLKIIDSIKLGEFIAFANMLNDLLGNSESYKIENVIGFKAPTVFMSKNRTLNLYAGLAEKYSKADCIYNEKQKFCKEIQIQQLSLINPIGKALLKTMMNPALNYKKIAVLAKKINALHL